MRGAVAEAVLLQGYIANALGWEGPVSIEPDSRSTLENVRNAVPWIESSDWTAFASNGFHAARARTYLAHQRPELAERLVAAEDYQLGEAILLKLLFAAVGLWKLRTVFHVKPPAESPHVPLEGG